MRSLFPTLHRLVLRSFMQPFFACFSVALFILVIQFLANYRDSLFGKGLGGWVIGQVFMFASVQLMLMALPISMLMASLMTFGKLGETYELAAMKSAGISLLRIMMPVIVVGLLLVSLAFTMAFEIIPRANLKLYSLIYDAKQAKPQFAIQPGFFNTMIDGYTIYVSDRDDDGVLYGLKIYDHTNTHPNNAQTRLILAERGTMLRNEAAQYLELNLYNGSQYEDMPSGQGHEGQSAAFPFARVYFDSLVYRLDISGFGLSRTDESAFLSHYYMMNRASLAVAIDSLGRVPLGEHKRIADYVQAYLPLGRRLGTPLGSDTARLPEGLQLPDSARLAMHSSGALAWVPIGRRAETLTRAKTVARSLLSYLKVAADQLREQHETTRRYQIEFYLRHTLPLSILFFLFIGAPLGAIIRKGGIGMPTVVSLVFVVLFYLVLTNGRKLAREGALEVWLGMLLPILVLAPMAAYLTYQSLRDGRILQTDAYTAPIKRLWVRLRKRNAGN
jgi:lipopolysaccharide export system permease protein